MNHPDLSSNTYSSSYDTENGTSPSVVRGSHGTAVAGIAGAVGNTIGIKGVAPNSKLISISSTMSINTTNIRQKLADGIGWAVNHGADVINNSWGHNDLSSSLIDNAITNALTNGRNGLGCVVIFSAGNDNGSVLYPANSNPDIIAVGAMSQCGQRKSPTSCDTEDLWGSNYGTTLDVVAPGVLIPTTDRQGNTGYNNQIAIHTRAGGSLLSSDYSDGNYTRWFNGTSAAAPHVAGVAALMLSVNPNLTQDQVRNIIESTAQKVRTDLYTYSNTTGRPNGTWNSQMGYGLVNAYAAVLASFRITGPTTLCSSGGSYSISNVPSGATITWSSGPDIQRQSDQGANPCTFRSISDGDSYVQATITYNGQTITLPSYNVYSGLPPAPPDRYAANVDGDDGYYTKILNSGTAYFTMTNTSSFGKWWDTQWATSTTHGGNDYYLDIDADVLGTNYVLPYWTNACGISAPGPSVILEVVLGKSANQGEISFGLSPNPAKQYVDIKLNLPDDMKAVGTYWVEFVNPYSVVAKKVELDGPENRVGVADLPKGYYVVKLRIGKEIYTDKLVIE